MANIIKVRRGVAANLPTLEAGQLGFTTDTHVLYVGDGVNNHALLMAGQVSAAGLALIDDATAAAQRVTLGVNGSLFINVKDYGAIGDNTTDDTDAIQSAFDAVAEGGTVFLPIGVYRITDTLIMTKGFNIIGAGYRAILSVDSSVGASTDVILVYPTVHSAGVGPLGDTAADGSVYCPFRFQDFQIAPKTYGTTPARYAINLDGQGFVQFREMLIDHVLICQFGSNAIYAHNVHSNGSPAVSTISNSVLYGGIKITSCGDRLSIKNNVFLGVGNSLDVDFTSGVSALIFEGNSIQMTGCLLVHGSSTTHAYALEIIGNEFETVDGFAGGTNGVLVDLDGAATEGVLRGTLIARNTFQKPLAYGAANSLRVNYSDRCIIRDNVFGAGDGASQDIVITANASGTVIGTNMWPYGNSAAITDGGTGTVNLLTTLASKLPLAGGTMTGDITLGENTAIALDPAGSADEKWSGITVTGTAGATLAVGDLCYLNSSWKWVLADADAASSSGSVCLGICLTAASDTQATKMLLQGTMRSAAFPASITGGAQLYVSQTAGDMTTTIPTGADVVVRVVGWAITTEPNTIYFNPSVDYLTRVS